MGLENEAADEVVKIVLDGTEYVVRIAGEGAKGAAAMLMAALQEKAAEGKKQGIGATRLQNMIRSGEKLISFELSNRDMEYFATEAKRYGIQYCVLRPNRDLTSRDTVEIMVKKSDAARANSIVDRILRLDRDDRAKEHPERDAERTRENEERANHGKEKNTRDPASSRTEDGSRSGRRSEGRDSISEGRPVRIDREGNADRPSVWQKLKDYREESNQEKTTNTRENERSGSRSEGRISGNRADRNGRSPVSTRKRQQRRINNNGRNR